MIRAGLLVRCTDDLLDYEIIYGGQGQGEMPWTTETVRIVVLTNVDRDAILDLARVAG